MLFAKTHGVLGDTALPRLGDRALANRRTFQAFTLIEIAISLAVIGFALVAIIGILPAGMNVQKENRQETLITQDASVLLNAIRNGERGVDDLTNYVVGITNFVSVINPNGSTAPLGTFWFTPSGSSPGGFPLTNGARIVGLLSTPKYHLNRSNYIVAVFRSMSGLASEKFPQTSQDAKDFAFQYRMLVEVLPMHTNHFDSMWTNYAAVDPGATNEVVGRSNYWRHALNAQSNYHDLRLTFRWPYQNGSVGNGRQSYRTIVGGQLTPTNEPPFPALEQRLFFFEPRNYVQVKP